MKHSPNAAAVVTANEREPVAPTPQETHTDRWLRRSQAAAHLSVSLSLLEKLDARGIGPKCARIGRACVYRLSDLNKFAESHLSAELTSRGPK